MLKKFLVIILVIAGNLSGDLIEISIPEAGKDFKFNIAEKSGVKYISLNTFAKTAGFRTYYRPDNGKILLFLPSKILKFTVNSSFVVVGNKTLNLRSKVLLVNEEIYVPLESFLKILRDVSFKRLVYRVTPTGTRYSITKPRSETFTRKEIVFSTIRKISIEDKFNGLVALIDVDRPIPDNNFSYYFRKGDQFYLTIYAAEVDTSKLIIENRSSLLKTVECMQLNESVQFIFKLVREFNSSDVHYDFASSKVLVSLFYPDRERVKEKIERARTRWFIDTVVLDPGHGGKDPGTLRRRGRLNEKDIALDIALRLGRLLETKGKLRVVYTRKTDTFLPLWKRTQIANNANGKLFISIHVNACDNRKISGVEFYLLRPGRSEEAIAVAEKENSVIKLETEADREKYNGYDDISNILANMVFSAYMKDSERLAEIVSRKFTEIVPMKNRGVRQAGFYVLIGASMPSLFCELGYISNREDERKLNSPRYRQLIAQALYESIVEFKNVCEKEVAGGG